jgi:hypothetical protein
MRALLVEIRLQTLNHTDHLEMPTKMGNNSYRNYITLKTELAPLIVYLFIFTNLN